MYFIDETALIAELVWSKEMPYSKAMGSVQNLKGSTCAYRGNSTNVVVDSCFGKTIFELDKDGNELIKLESAVTFYRVLKLYI